MSTNALISFLPGQKIKATETNQNNNFLLDQITSQINSLRSEVENTLDDFRDSVLSGSLGVGDVKLAVYDTVPANFLVCNGASLLISDYQDLYDVIGGTYGKPDSTHFKLPDFRDRVPEGFNSTSEPFGSYQTGKVPNITGTFIAVTNTRGTSGAFTYTAGGGATVEPEGNQFHHNDTFNFNASRSSSVYASVTRVTVNRVKVNYLIKYKD